MMTGRANQNSYALNPNKPLFSLDDDDGDMERAFLRSSGPSYMAADKLPLSAHERAAAEAEERRQNLLMQMKQVEQRTLQSTSRSLGLLNDSEQVGIETAQALVQQREQLQNTENNLDDINSSLKDTQKNISSINSVVSSLRQWWSAPKAKKDEKDKGDSAKSPVTPNGGKSPVSVSTNPHLGAAFDKSQESLSTGKTRSIHPSLRMREGDEEQDEGLHDPKAFSQHVNTQLDQDLDDMFHGLSRLKGLAQGLGSEIQDQNALLDRIQTKAEKADLSIGSQNTQMQKILKK